MEAEVGMQGGKQGKDRKKKGEIKEEEEGGIQKERGGEAVEWH